MVTPPVFALPVPAYSRAATFGQADESELAETYGAFLTEPLDHARRQCDHAPVVGFGHPRQSMPHGVKRRRQIDRREYRSTPRW